MGQVLQGGDQRPNRMAHRSSFAARCSSGSQSTENAREQRMRRIVFYLSSFDCDCQCCSFPNRDNISTRKFDVEASRVIERRA
jgi:hypothetical protein